MVVVEVVVVVVVVVEVVGTVVVVVVVVGSGIHSPQVFLHSQCRKKMNVHPRVEQEEDRSVHGVWSGSWQAPQVIRQSVSW